ncbi:MAG: hypothetical protein WCD20_06860 [Rhodomicrobium sp.]
MVTVHHAWLAMFAAFLPFGPVLADEQSVKDPPANAAWSAGLMVSTLGPGLQVSYRVYDWAAIRVEGTYVTVPTGGLNLTLESAGVILDLHPFESGFRISGGARYLEYDVLGDTTVNESGGPNRFRIEVANSDKAAPYAGLGFDSSHFSGGEYELKIGLDLGVIYTGKPVVSVTNLDNPGNDVQTQIDKYVNQYQIFNFYPVATISARLNF